MFVDIFDFKVEVRKEDHFFFIVFREFFWHHNVRMVPFSIELNCIFMRSESLSDFFVFRCADKWFPINFTPHDHPILRVFDATIKKTFLFRIHVNLPRVICFFVVFIQLLLYPGNHSNEICIWIISHCSMNIWIGFAGEEAKKTFQGHIFGFFILLLHLI